MLILPVATMGSRRGVDRRRWPSRKSLSLVTTTRSSASARRAISASLSGCRPVAPRCAQRRGRRTQAAGPGGTGAGRRGGTSRSAEGYHPTHPGGEGAELKNGQEVVTLKVGVVLDDRLDGHSRGEEVEEPGHWVAKPADRQGSDNLRTMSEVSATEAARSFADLLDAVEHRGERFTIVRRGKAIASLQPVKEGHGGEVKEVLRRHRPDQRWKDDLEAVRSGVELEERP